MAHNSNRLPIKKIRSLFTEEGLPLYYVGFEVEGVLSMDQAAGTILVEYTMLVDWWDHKDLVGESTPSWTFRRCVSEVDRTTEEYKSWREKHKKQELVKYRKTQYGLVQLVFDPDLQYFPFDRQKVSIQMEFSSFQDSSVSDHSVEIRGYDLRKKTRLRAFRTFLDAGKAHWAYRPLKSAEEYSGKFQYAATYPCVVHEARRFRTYDLSVKLGSCENEIYEVIIELNNDPSAYLVAHHIPYMISALFILFLWVSRADATTEVAVSNAIFNAGYYLASNPSTTNNQVSYILCLHLVVNEISVFSLVAGAKFWIVIIVLCIVFLISYTCYRRDKKVSFKTAVQSKLKYDEVSKTLKDYEKKEIEKLFNAVDSGNENYDDFMNPTRLTSQFSALLQSAAPPAQDSPAQDSDSERPPRQHPQPPPLQPVERSPLLHQP